ncbi:MAG: type I glutamate--ammonia ligase [Nitrososphaerota archaeon]|nr:type I glutamate--ammonia ligase [Candidatus Calditenuaceae archaeon]MDW8073493.1 type I glutamate--ammonia ligase [Nitrososphaerota archaeon]
MPYVFEKGEPVPWRMTIDQMLESMERDGVKYIDLQFTDVPGRLQHVTVPIKFIDEHAFTSGIPKLDGSSIRGFVDIHESDLVLYPDPSTYAIIPWMPDHVKTARAFCNVGWGLGRGRFEKDPRNVAQRAEAYAAEQGYDLSLWGPEIEFFVFDRVQWDVLNAYRGQSYSIESKEAAWTSPGTNYPVRFKEGYYPVPPHDTLMVFRSEVVNILMDYFHIPCDAHHHEVATAGQCEIDMYRDTLTNMGDNSMTYKFVVKNLAHKNGMIATFMPKPIFGDNASGMHTHVSLWRRSGKVKSNPGHTILELDGRENLFYDENDDYAELSQLGRYFAGGLLEHSRALCGIVAPTTNSYRRLVPGYEAPVFVAWSRSNRSANVRIPVYHKGRAAASKKRIEFRTPDPSCNPYLCFAAIMAAGLDGIKKKTDIGDPVDEDIYKLTPEKRRQLGIKQLPGSLKEALEELETDHDFLKPIFPKELIETVIENGMKEYTQVSARPHPYEFYLYFDI